MPRMVTRRGHALTTVVMHKAFGVATDQPVNVSETFPAKTAQKREYPTHLVMIVRYAFKFINTPSMKPVVCVDITALLAYLQMGILQTYCKCKTIGVTLLR